MDSGRKNVGRPNANVAAGYLMFRYCGGMGGGGCVTPYGATGVVLTFQIPRFVVFNKRILFENKEWFGVRIFTDGGAVGLCDHSLGTPVPFRIALSADGQLTDAEVQQRGQLVQSDSLPYDIEFLAKDIPQPKEANWLGYLFMHIYWGNTGYINEGGVITDNSMRIKKHDYDIKI